jgi:hypothetical protein
MEAIAEQRRSARFATDECTLVAIGRDSKLGEVLNVSLGGLSFRCLGAEETLMKDGELNVYCNKGFCLVNLPFKTRWDLEISDSPPFDYFTTRRFGVRFGDLTQEQISMLYTLIRDHTQADPEG